jgi:imidazolonepropionase-like amidohydrolase
MDILRAMTSEAATLLRISKERGAIAEGLRADIIALPANPLTDIQNLRKVDFVMKNGTVVRKP